MYQPTFLDVAVSVIAVIAVIAVAFWPIVSTVKGEVRDAAKDAIRNWWPHATMIALMFFFLSFVE